MKNKPFTVAIHALVWVLLLVIPYVSTDQIFNFFVPEAGGTYLILSLGLSSVLLTVFYYNYFVLIPQYLLTQKYWQYFVFLFLAIAIAFHRAA